MICKWYFDGNKKNVLFENISVNDVNRSFFFFFSLQSLIFKTKTIHRFDIVSNKIDIEHFWSIGFQILNNICIV